VIGKTGTIGPATDIYALGAVLYEMLTGRPPFPGETAAETERQVLHDEPVSPTRLNPKVPRDLETICLKCLVKEPGRRYAGAAALAADLRRYMEGRPIQARRVRVLEHAWRWCRRNPAMAGLAAAAFLALAIGTAVSTWQMFRARRAEAEMRAVLEFVEDRVLAAARPEGRPGGLGREVTLRQAIDAALPAVAGSFAAQPLVEARLRRTLGQSYSDLGEPGTAAEQYEASRALYARHRGPDDPETLRSMHGLASSYRDLGRLAEALKHLEETLALGKAKLDPDRPETLTSMNNLATSYHVLGRHAEALKLLEETLALRNANLGPDHADTLTSMHNLAVNHRALGRWDEALAAYGRAIALGTDVHDTWNHAAILWARTGDRAGYRGLCRAMLDRFGPTTDPMIAERTAKACLVVPLGGPEQDAACDLADRAVALRRATGWCPGPRRPGGWPPTAASTSRRPSPWPTAAWRGARGTGTVNSRATWSGPWPCADSGALTRRSRPGPGRRICTGRKSRVRAAGPMRVAGTTR
jgi:tetratricopeptide (TPR) repeat protein